MNSIGDLIDKLIIENIKIFNLRENMHSKKLSDEHYVTMSNQMNLLNKNRSTISNFLDDKIDRVVDGKEKNTFLNIIKTYDENGYYHVYNRGVERRNIFLDDQDYRVFLSYLRSYLSPIDDLEKIAPSRKLKNYFGTVDLLCYCLMPNHYHMLIRQHVLTAITGFIRSISTRYAMYFNKKYRRSGHLFQGIYRAVLIESEAQLLHLSRYIHRNPDPTGFNPVGFMQYLYSSLPNYLGKMQQPWIESQEISSLFSKSNVRNSYGSFMLESADLSDISSSLIDFNE